MKKVLASLFLGLLVSVQACAQVELWQEGKHYEVIAETASKKPIVTEYFSFWCPGCYRYEPLVAEFKANLPEGVKFLKVQVNFMRFASKDVQDMATKAMLIGRVMKEEEKYNAAIFNYIHEQRKILSNFDDFRNIFIANGADPEKFDKLANGFSMKNLVNKNNKNVNAFRRDLTGVPTFIINEKFKPKFTNDMTIQDMVNLVNWLSQQK